MLVRAMASYLHSISANNILDVLYSSLPVDPVVRDSAACCSRPSTSWLQSTRYSRKSTMQISLLRPSLAIRCLRPFKRSYSFPASHEAEVNSLVWVPAMCRSCGSSVEGKYAATYHHRSRSSSRTAGSPDTAAASTAAAAPLPSLQVMAVTQWQQSGQVHLRHQYHEHGYLASTCMVYVFPLPVWPYAKHVAFPPPRHGVSRGCTLLLHIEHLFAKG